MAGARVGKLSRAEYSRTDTRMIGATMAGPPTVADLRRAGHISSQEVVAAIDVYLRDPTAGRYRFASGHSLDIAALVASRVSPEQVAPRSSPQENAFRIALASAIMAACPTPP